MTHPALLYDKISPSLLHCHLCNQQCHIKESHFGFCGVRQNINGALVTHSYGNVIASHVDPIEKKPLFHFLPGSHSYSIGLPGCNFHCEFCQNWQISQQGKEEVIEEAPFTKPEAIVNLAKQYDCPSISYTYTEPTIFFEYAYDTARLAQAAGLYNIFVTNGYMTAEAIDIIAPYLDAANIDLKSFNDASYRDVCRGRLQPVLDSIQRMHEKGIWVEVTTLVIPGLNDSDEELTKIAEFIASIDVDIPWHLTRYHPDYKFTNAEPTPPQRLERGHEIGKAHGLHFVYLGNVIEGQNTVCYRCGITLVKRSGYGVYCQSLPVSGRCPNCSAPIAGKWTSQDLSAHLQQGQKDAQTTAIKKVRS
jgi:pyruvate formate lyase activating enzyme